MLTAWCLATLVIQWADALEPLAGLTALRSLALRLDDVADACMRVIGSLTGLTSLRIMSFHPHGIALGMLTNLNELRVLEISPQVCIEMAERHL